MLTGVQTHFLGTPLVSPKEGRAQRTMQDTNPCGGASKGAWRIEHTSRCGRNVVHEEKRTRLVDRDARDGAASGRCVA